MGPTLGGRLIDIAGTGFRVPGPPSEIGPTSPPRPTMLVVIGGRPASDVRVLSAEHLTCCVPIGDPGAAAVVVTSLDDLGAPLPDETAVALDAFQYHRPSLTLESDLTRLVRTVIQALARGVVDNVVLTVHTDFEEGADVHLANLAKLPGLVLIGPELGENRLFSTNVLPEVADGEGGYTRRRAPYTVDLTFVLVGVATHTTELLNLASATQLFLARTTYLEMARDPARPEEDFVRYELAVPPDGAVKVTSAPNESNVRSLSARFIVRGFDLEELAGFAGESVVERGAATSGVAVASLEPLAGSR